MSYRALKPYPGIPQLTPEEEKYYENLVQEAANFIGVPKVIKRSESWLRSDERDRLLWYFWAKMIAEDQGELEKMKEEIDSWKDDPDTHDYWYEKWAEIIKKVEAGQLSILYEQSGLMQQLRSKSPIRRCSIDQKLRCMVICNITGRMER